VARKGKSNLTGKPPAEPDLFVGVPGVSVPQAEPELTGGAMAAGKASGSPDSGSGTVILVKPAAKKDAPGANKSGKRGVPDPPSSVAASGPRRNPRNT
jgi:hypothetical protein